MIWILDKMCPLFEWWSEQQINSVPGTYSSGNRYRAIELQTILIEGSKMFIIQILIVLSSDRGTNYFLSWTKNNQLA